MGYVFLALTHQCDGKQGLHNFKTKACSLFKSKPNQKQSISRYGWCWFWSPMLLTTTHVLQMYVHIDGLVQDCGNPSVLAMELLQSCTKPSICDWHHTTSSFYLLTNINTDQPIFLTYQVSIMTNLPALLALIMASLWVLSALEDESFRNHILYHEMLLRHTSHQNLACLSRVGTSSHMKIVITENL